jgi:hypothetical protein
MKQVAGAFAMSLALWAAAAGGASATDLTGTPIAEEGQAHAVGCSLESIRPKKHSGDNYQLHGSFVVDGPEAATAVRLVFVETDELGTRHSEGVVATGSFTPGARIDLPEQYGGRGPVHHFKSLSCYVREAKLADGSLWRPADLDIPGVSK